MNELQSFVGRGDLILWVNLLDLSLRIHSIGGEVTGPVEIEVAVQNIPVEAIDFSGVFLGMWR